MSEEAKEDIRLRTALAEIGFTKEGFELALHAEAVTLADAYRMAKDNKHKSWAKRWAKFRGITL